MVRIVNIRGVFGFLLQDQVTLFNIKISPKESNNINNNFLNQIYKALLFMDFRCLFFFGGGNLVK